MLRARGTDERVIALHEYLDWGPIDCSLGDRVAWIEAHSPSDIGWDWLEESVEEFLAAVAGVDRPLLWIAPQNANELSGLYWYLDKIRPSEAEILVADFPIHGNWRNEPPLGLGQLSTELLAQVLDRSPEPWNAEQFRPDRWSELAREGALLRIAKVGQLYSAPADRFDENLLRNSPREWTRWHRVVGDTMGKAWDHGDSLNDSFLRWRLMEMVRHGRLELDGDLAVQMNPKAAAKVRLV
jgi:Protein of unknown function